MSEQNNKDFDFDTQCAKAKIDEKKLEQILISGKVELKTECGIWHNSGNIAIEYESHGKPSGIAATKADYWAHELRTKDNQTLAYLVFPTPILRKICNKLMDEEGNWRRGGEGNNMEMVLVNLEKVLIGLQNFSGPGDNSFLTRRERERK